MTSLWFFKDKIPRELNDGFGFTPGVKELLCSLVVLVVDPGYMRDAVVEELITLLITITTRCIQSYLIYVISLARSIPQGLEEASKKVLYETYI
jgi:hypothetical protein